MAVLVGVVGRSVSKYLLGEVTVSSKALSHTNLKKQERLIAKGRANTCIEFASTYESSEGVDIRSLQARVLECGQPIDWFEFGCSILIQDIGIVLDKLKSEGRNNLIIDMTVRHIFPRQLLFLGFSRQEWEDSYVRIVEWIVSNCELETITEIVRRVSIFTPDSIPILDVISEVLGRHGVDQTIVEKQIVKVKEKAHKASRLKVNEKTMTQFIAKLQPYLESCSEGSAESVYKKLLDIRPVWEITPKKVPVESLNRLGSMFGGFPFTSQAYPWPLGEDDQPLSPLAQIALSAVTKLTKQSFGQGLLQVWLDYGSPEMTSIVRVIPESECLRDNLNDECLRGGSEYEDICSVIKFKKSGSMCHSWGDTVGALMDECHDVILDKLDDEKREAFLDLIENFEKYVEDSGYGVVEKDWLLGYPDMGSGAPAGRYIDPPSNFIQFATEDSFPMAIGARFCNLFYSTDKEGVVFFSFDY